MSNLITGFHIELTNICTLKCAGCSRTQFIKKWPQHWKNYNLDFDNLFRFLDLNLHSIRIVLSGNYGDPIYHPNMLQFVEEFKKRGALLTIITNGSYKPKSWWEKLVAQLDTDDNVVFSVDGTPENFTQYRENADWPSIQEGMIVCGQASCNTVWKYIPFGFNEDTIEQAKEFSKSLNIKNFQIALSDRFDEHTQHLVPSQQLLNPRYNSKIQWKNNFSKSSLDPRCAKGNEHFISANGFYSPCCYVAEHNFYYKTVFGKNKNHYDISNTTLSQVLQQQNTVDFNNNLDDQSVCQFNCSKTQ